MSHLLGGDVRRAGRARVRARAVRGEATSARLLSGLRLAAARLDEPRRLDRAAAAGFRGRSARARATRSRPSKTATRRLFGILFHPEVAHTERGHGACSPTSSTLCGCQRDWNAAVLRRGGGRAHPRAGRARGACSARSRAASTRRWRRCWCTRRSATGSPACSWTTACCARTRRAQVRERFARAAEAQGRVRGRLAALPGAAAGRRPTPSASARSSAREFIEVVRASRARGWATRALPGAGHALPRRDRVDLGARAFGGDQEPPQRGRAAAAG